MGSASRSRNKAASSSSLVSSPWQISVALAALTYVGLKWVLPGLVIGNPILKALAGALAPQAGLFAGVFLFIAVLAFVKTKAGQVRRGDSAATPGSGIDHRLSAINYRRELQGFAGLPVPENAVSSPGAGKPAVWTIELIRDIEWKRFEDVCQQYYESKGIRSETTALGPDGGIDIRLFQDDSGKATSIVQCKAWGERFVGVKPVRELLGVMTHEKIVKAFFMTSGKYSDEAKDFAKANRITLIDGEMFLMMINRLPEPASDKLLDFATAGDYRTPSCPRCGVKMRAVKGRGGKADFWGCQRYPACRQRLGMRRAG